MERFKSHSSHVFFLLLFGQVLAKTHVARANGLQLSPKAEHRATKPTDNVAVIFCMVTNLDVFVCLRHASKQASVHVMCVSSTTANNHPAHGASSLESAIIVFELQRAITWLWGGRIGWVHWQHNKHTDIELNAIMLSAGVGSLCHMKRAICNCKRARNCVQSAGA